MGPTTFLAHTGAAGWDPAPAVLVPAALAAALFVRAFVRLRRRGRADHAPWSRAALFAAGLAAAVLALVSPLDRLAEDDLLSAHMLQHVAIGDLAPALLLTALRGPLLFFLVPAAVLGPVARSGRVRAALDGLTRPRVAFGLWSANLAVWHVPALYDAALTRPALHDLEHACWLVTGLLVWTLLADPAAHRTRRACPESAAPPAGGPDTARARVLALAKAPSLSRGRGHTPAWSGPSPTAPHFLDRPLTVGGRIALAVCMFAAGQILTDVLVFSFTPLYPAYTGSHGLSAVADQQLAGVVMMVEQLLTLGALTALLLRPRLRRRPAEPATA